MALGQNLIAVREALGWSQEELAKECKITPSTVGMIEQRDSAKSKIAVPVAKRIGIPLELLLTGTPIEIKAALSGQNSTGTTKTQEPSPTPYLQASWPFRTVTRQQWALLDDFDRGRIEEAINAILNTLPPTKKSA